MWFKKSFDEETKIFKLLVKKKSCKKFLVKKELVKKNQAGLTLGGGGVMTPSPFLS